jgi:hypothetical protein
MTDFNLHEWRNKYLFENDMSSGKKNPTPGGLYDLDGGEDSGYISTGGSPNERDWKFISANKRDKNRFGKNITYPFLSVKDRLTVSDNQPPKFDAKAFSTLDNVGYHKGSMEEGQDHEVSMAISSLKSIVSSATQLMNMLGQEEKDIPAWIQDHITNAENYINQASKNYHEYGDDAEGDMHDNSITEYEDDYEDQYGYEDEDEYTVQDFENALDTYLKQLNNQNNVPPRPETLRTAFNKLKPIDQPEALELVKGLDVLIQPAP